MPFLGSIFKCSSKDESNESNKEIDYLKSRVSRLESKYDNINQILMEIRMDIKLINMNIQQLNHNN